MFLLELKIRNLKYLYCKLISDRLTYTLLKNYFTFETSTALPLSFDRALIMAGLRGGPAGQLSGLPTYKAR